MRQRTNIDETVERPIEPRAHLAFIVGTVGISEHLEAVTIMALEQFCHQVRGGMLMKISRQIAKANASAPNARVVRKGGFRRRPDRPDPVPGTDQLIGCGRRRRKQVKRRNTNSGPHHVQQLVLVGLVVVPFARLRTMIDELAERIGVIGP